MIDDPLGRCFRIYDGDDVEFISISIVEKQQLPEEIKKYFNMKSPQRETVAVKEVSQYVGIGHTNYSEVFANEVVESLRQWAFTDITGTQLELSQIQKENNSLKAFMIAIYDHFYVNPCIIKHLNDSEKLLSIKSIVDNWLSNACPLCKGDGKDPIQYGGLTKVCRICEGSGKRQIT